MPVWYSIYILNLPNLVQCEVKNTSEYRLLPGPVSVFLDDSYVSKTTIQVCPHICESSFKGLNQVAFLGR